MSRSQKPYEYVFVPKATFWVKNETTLVLVLFVALFTTLYISIIVSSSHDSSSGGLSFPIGHFVWANILLTMKIVQKNILVSLSSTTIEGFAPVVKYASKCVIQNGNSYTDQELPAKLVSCLVRRRIWTLLVMAIWKNESAAQCLTNVNRLVGVSANPSK